MASDAIKVTRLCLPASQACYTTAVCCHRCQCKSGTWLHQRAGYRQQAAAMAACKGGQGLTTLISVSNSACLSEQQYIVRDGLESLEGLFAA